MISGCIEGCEDGSIASAVVVREKIIALEIKVLAACSLQNFVEVLLLLPFKSEVGYKEEARGELRVFRVRRSLWVYRSNHFSQIWLTKPHWHLTTSQLYNLTGSQLLVPMHPKRSNLLRCNEELLYFIIAFFWLLPTHPWGSVGLGRRYRTKYFYLRTSSVSTIPNSIACYLKYQVLPCQR